MGKSEILGLALAGIGALAATNVMAASPVKVGGLVQTDYVTFSGDDQNTQTNWTAFNTSTDVRRANFYLKGEIDDVWSYQVLWDATSEDTNNTNGSRLGNTWVGFNGFEPMWFAVGQVAVPFGAESFGGASATTFMEHGSVDRFNPGDGVGLYGEGNMDMMGYSFAFVAPTYDTASSSSDDPWVWGMRLHAAPVAMDDNVYHFGVSYSHRNVASDANADVWNGPAYNVRSLGQAGNNTVLVQSVGGTNGEVDNVNTWALEAATTMGPLYAHAEYARQELEGRARNNTNDVDLKAWFVQASYMLTGESRPYDSGSGTFGRVKPASNMGAWEVAARYDVLDLSDDGTGYAASNYAGKQKGTTLGVNWYANDNVKFQLNYTHADVDYINAAGTNDRELNTFGLRAQVRF